MTRKIFLAGQRASSSQASRPATAVEPRGRADGWATHMAVAALGLAASAAVLACATATGTSRAVYNDFYHEVWPSYHALAHGHVLEFLRLGPPYFGSLLLRAPFALVPAAWGAGWRAVYLASAVPCMIAVVAFCTWLAAQPRKRGGVGWASRLSPVVLCILNPVILITVIGDRHPEELLGAVLCVAGVVLAVKGKVGWAGFLIGIAVINKSWALVAVPVALATMPGDRRRGLLIAGLTAGAVLMPITLLREHGFSASATGAQLGSQSGTIFNPPQLLWWLGPHSWIVGHARPAFVLISVLCAAIWRAGRAHARPYSDGDRDALLLLVLVLLLRAALDPWNNLYYHVPFLFALMAYEVRSGRMPLLTISYSLALVVIVPLYGVPHMSQDLRATVYAALVVPTLGWLAVKLYAPPGAWKRNVATRGLASLARPPRADVAPTYDG